MKRVNDTLADMRKRLRSVREQRGMSQSDLSSQAGVSQSLISQVEAGLKTPALDTLLAILTSLQISPGELFGTESTGETAQRLATAHDSYREIRDHYDRLFDVLSKIYAFMRDHTAELMHACPVETTQEFEELCKSAHTHTRERVQSGKGMETSISFWKQLPSVEAIKAASQLLNGFGRLSESDQEIVCSLTRRLASQTDSCSDSNRPG